ncbi:MAG: hypothetical protein ACE5FZ_08810 [Nitrospiria bacterium]
MSGIIRFLSFFMIAGLLAACSSNSDGGGPQPVLDPGTPPTLSKIFTVSDLAHETVPERTIGADNYIPQGSTVFGANEFHFAGRDCLRCHKAGEKAGSIPFSMAGTVYKDNIGSEPIAGAEVVILDAAGKVISMTTNAAGNFFTQVEIADADPDPGRIDRAYKTWVLGPDGTILPMLTMTSHSCNMHHTPFNRRGALWAGSWSASPDAANAVTVSFNKHVLPIFAAKCAPCHVPTSGRLNEPRKGTNPVTGATYFFDYTAGFDLLRYEAILDNSSGTVVSRQAPESGRKFFNLTDDPATERDDREDSLMLVKMLSPESGHAGGKLAVDSNDPDYQTILRWIIEGAVDDTVMTP